MSNVVTTILSVMGALFGVAICLFIVLGSLYMAYKKVTKRFTTYVYLMPVDILLAISQRDIKIEATTSPSHILITFANGHQAQIDQNGNAWAALNGQYYPVAVDTVLDSIRTAPMRSTKQPKQPQPHNHNGNKPQIKPTQQTAPLAKVERLFKKGKTWSNRPNIKLPKPYHWSQDQYSHDWCIARH